MQITNLIMEYKSFNLYKYINFNYIFDVHLYTYI